MVVVAYLYNNNGMATWCIESALAIHKSGVDVILVKSKNLKLPHLYPVKSIDFDTSSSDFSQRSILQKVLYRLIRYSKLLPFTTIEDTFLMTLHSFLNEKSICPRCYILNQSNLVNPAINTPQYLVAWSYPPMLNDYIKKTIRTADNISTFFTNLYNAIYWHKSDWQGYKNATAVLPVSKSFTNLLKINGINAYTVYPGSSKIDISPIVCNDNKKIRLVVMALDLEDKRKGLKKIIKCLKTLPNSDRFSLTLIGDCSDDFKQWVKKSAFSVSFTGRLKREDALEKLNDCDVLLFGSLVDDWGYVQVEAMAKGIAIISPNASPFDEIVGRPDYLYDIDNDMDFIVKIKNVVEKDDFLKDKEWFQSRYNQLFCSEAFFMQLSTVINFN